MPTALRTVLRVGESLVLSALAGVFVAALGLFFGRIPLVFAAFLGFLTGGTATLRTLGVVILHRGRRMLLAAVCALLGWGVLQAIEYQNFRRDQRARQRTADWRATPPELDRRTDDDLARTTGHPGAVGYAYSAIEHGMPVLGVRIRGLALVGFFLLETALALGVAMRWAGGRKRSPTGLETHTHAPLRGRAAQVRPNGVSRPAGSGLYAINPRPRRSGGDRLTCGRLR